MIRMISKTTGICLLLSMLLLSACAIAEEPATPQIETDKGKSSTEAAAESKGNACQFILDNELLETAEKGQLKGLKVNLNHSRSELEQAYGQPDEVGFENADYLKYDNCYFYIWDEDKIGVIDIKINESVEQVKKVLGEPDSEGNSDGGYDEYGFSYTTGEYSLYFMYEDAASTEGIVRIKSMN